MKIYSKECLVWHASTGACDESVLLVPENLYGWFEQTGRQPNPIEIPDEWVCRLGENYLPLQSGDLWFTRKGYEANKNKLKKALAEFYYEIQTNCHLAWEGKVEKHFSTVEANIEKEKIKLKNRLEELEQFIV